jgi:hypothetical protein
MISKSRSSSQPVIARSDRRCSQARVLDEGGAEPPLTGWLDRFAFWSETIKP